MCLASDSCPTSAPGWEEKLNMSDICSRSAPGSTWVCPWAPGVSHTSFSLPDLFHSFIMQASCGNNAAGLPLTRPEKKILLGFSGLPLSCPQTEAFLLLQVSFNPTEEGAARTFETKISVLIYAETDHPLWKNIFLTWALPYVEIPQI